MAKILEPASSENRNFKITSLSLKYDGLNLGTNLLSTPKPLTINTQSPSLNSLSILSLSL